MTTRWAYEALAVEQFKNNEFEKIFFKDEQIISNADYKTTVKKLERWFGVKFENLNKEPLWNLDAKFENASLEQILDILAHSEQFEYQLSENTVKLKLQ